MRRTYKIFKRAGSLGAVVLGVLSLSATLAHATTVDDILVETALDNNPELRYYQALVAQAAGKQRQAGAWKNPQLELEGGYKQVRPLTGAGATETGYVVGAGFSQTFEFPGKGSLRQAIADQNLYVAELSLEQFRLSLAAKVRQQALKYHTAVTTADMAQQIDQRSSDLINLLKQRAIGGAKPLLELRVIQASQIEMSQMAKEAVIARGEAQAELNALLGESSRRPVEIPDDSYIDAPGQGALTLEGILQSAFQHNLLLKVRQAEINSAQLAHDAERLAAFPDFEIGPFFSMERAGEEEITIGGRVSLEIPIWNQNQGNIASARAMELAAQAHSIMAQQQLEHEVTARWNVYQATRAQYDHFDKTMMTDMAAAAALAERQYRQGAIDVQLYLETQRAWLNARKIYDEVLLDLWNLRLDLELLTGGKGLPQPVSETKKKQETGKLK